MKRKYSGDAGTLVPSRERVLGVFAVSLLGFAVFFAFPARALAELPESSLFPESQNLRQSDVGHPVVETTRDPCNDCGTPGPFSQLISTTAPVLATASETDPASADRRSIWRLPAKALRKIQRHLTDTRSFVRTLALVRRGFQVTSWFPEPPAEYATRVFREFQVDGKQKPVPEELVWTIAAESGWNPAAVGPEVRIRYWDAESRTYKTKSDRAVGACQFISETAKAYGMKVRSPIPIRAVAKDAQGAPLFENGEPVYRIVGYRPHPDDDRAKLDKCVPAMARMLREAYDRLGDWDLALAAYNWGPHRPTLKKLKNTPGFWASSDGDKVPQSVRSYILKIRAMARVALHHPLHPQNRNQPQLASNPAQSQGSKARRL